MLRNALVLTCLAMLLPACASIDRGVIDHVRVDSVPQGARVTVLTDHRLGTERDRRDPARHYTLPLETKSCPATPCAIPLYRQQEALVRIEADGYEPFEYYVGPSRLRSGGGANLAATVATSAGTGALVGATAASVAALTVALSNALVIGTVQAAGLVATGGQVLIPGSALAGSLPAAPSAGSAVAAGTGIGLGVAATSLAVDAGTGANLNLAPNPVVIGLVPDGRSGPKDVLAEAFKGIRAAEAAVASACQDSATRTSGRIRRSEPCKAALADLRDLETAFRDTKRAQEDDLREALRQARAAQKA